MARYDRISAMRYYVKNTNKIANPHAIKWERKELKFTYMLTYFLPQETFSSFSVGDRLIVGTNEELEDKGDSLHLNFDSFSHN